MSEKPDWFELAGEESQPEVRKAKRPLFKVALIAAPLLLVGAAVVAANGEEEGSGPKISPIASASPTASNPVTDNSASATPKASSSKVKIKIKAKVSKSPATAVTKPTATSSKPAVGVPAPKANGGDDDGHVENHQPGDHHRERNGAAPKIPNSTAAPQPGSDD